MDKKTKGAWLVHHAQKIEAVNGVRDFDKIYAAGKSAVLLSALAGTNQTSLSNARVEVLAKAANINTLFELPKLIELLKQQGLIDRSKEGVDVLGITSPSVIQHAAAVYEALDPSPMEDAALELAELASVAPVKHSESRAFLADTHKLTREQAGGLLEQAEHSGFVDFEDLGGDKIYFNGNLFRRQDLRKIQAVLDSLSAEDRNLVTQVEELLRSSGCVAMSEVSKILGPKLFEKLTAISLYDVNVVNNDTEDIAFVTRPAAFSKYGNPLVEDALDLAKAFVSSLTYGMTRSAHERGRITMIEKLMKALIAGRWIGPVEAIGQDYRALELKGVVQVKPETRGFVMKLLKKDVGEIALAVIKAGDATDAGLRLPGATVTGYTGPEANRTSVRRKQQATSKRATRDVLTVLRTGGALN